MSEIETLHKPFMRFLCEHGIPFVRARSDQKSTINKGHPDFTLLLGKFCACIEFKWKSEKEKPDQKERIAELQAAGVTVVVIRDLAVAIEFTLAWKATLGEIVPTGKKADVPKEEVVNGMRLRRRDDGTYDRIL